MNEEKYISLPEDIDSQESLFSIKLPETTIPKRILKVYKVTDEYDISQNKESNNTKNITM